LQDVRRRAIDACRQGDAKESEDGGGETEVKTGDGRADGAEVVMIVMMERVTKLDDITTIFRKGGFCDNQGNCNDLMTALKNWRNETIKNNPDMEMTEEQWLERPAVDLDSPLELYRRASRALKLVMKRVSEPAN
jgi:hypothetical protein